MADVLDDLLEGIFAREKKNLSLVKTADGDYRALLPESLAEEYGELVEIERRKMTVDGIEREAPVYEQKVTEEEKQAQASRASKYGIAVKSGGSVTMPKQWKDKGLKDDDFADPANYRYPLHDEAHVRNALSRWGDADNRKGYTADEQEVIEKRIMAAAKKFNINADSLENDNDADDKKKSVVTSTETVAGRLYDVERETDSLGRVNTTYILNGAKLDARVSQQMSFVQRGGIAAIRAPKDVPAEEMRQIISDLSQHKSVSTGQREQSDGTEPDDAIVAAYKAFSDALAKAWMADMLDDNTVKAAGEKLINDLAAQDPDTLVRSVKQMSRTSEKAGAAISRERRDRIRAMARDLLAMIGEPLDQKDAAGLHPKGVGGQHHSTTELTEVRAEVERLKVSTAAELKAVKAEREKLASENSDLRGQVVSMEQRLHDVTKQPLPDPTKPGVRKDAVPGSYVENTIYDFASDIQ